MDQNTIVDLRKSLGLSREAFAQRCGPPMTASKVWAVETGKRLPRPDEEEVLKRVASGSLQELLQPETILQPSLLSKTTSPVNTTSEVIEREIIPDDEVPPWAIPDGARRFSNSEVQTYKDCKRKWWLGWYRSLKPIYEAPTGKSHSGSRVHTALMAWYVPEGKTPTNPRDALERAIVEDWTLLNAGEFPPSEEAIKKFQNLNGLERAMIEGYMEWIEETGIDSGLKVIAPETYLEASLEVPYKEQDIRIIGKIDVRMYRQLDGVRLFVDHKTVDSISGHVQMLPLNEQMVHYHLLEFLGTAEGEARCDGALYNMLRRVKRTARAAPPFYERVEVRHNIHELNTFKDRLASTIGNILEDEAQLDQGVSHHKVVPPRPSGDCSWKCNFFSICPMFNDGSRIEDLIMTYYREGDPLEYYSKAIQDSEEVNNG